MRPGELLNRVLSASAGLMALAALGTAVYSAWLTREQQRMSVWPYISQDNSYRDGFYQRYVLNHGLGPALVRSFEVRVDGKPTRDWGEVFQRLGVVPEAGSITYSDLGTGTVLTPGSTLTLIEVRDTLVRPLMRARTDRMATIVCYCSLLGECWRDDSAGTGPERAKCRADDPAAFARQHAGATVRTHPPGQPPGG